jgi:hypothetical protein
MLRLGAVIIKFFQPDVPPRTVLEGIVQMRSIKVLHTIVLLE